MIIYAVVNSQPLPHQNQLVKLFSNKLNADNYIKSLGIDEYDLHFKPCVIEEYETFDLEFLDMNHLVIGAKEN